MGVHVRHRGRHFEAALDVVLRLLAGETVTTREPHHIQEARISPLPPGGGRAVPGAMRRPRR
jgi:hypothetical protein